MMFKENRNNVHIYHIIVEVEKLRHCAQRESFISSLELMIGMLFFCKFCHPNSLQPPPKKKHEIVLTDA